MAKYRGVMKEFGFEKRTIQWYNIISLGTGLKKGYVRTLTVL